MYFFFHLQMHPAKEPGCTAKASHSARCNWTIENNMWGSIRSRAWERVLLRIAVLRRTPKGRKREREREMPLVAKHAKQNRGMRAAG